MREWRRLWASLLEAPELEGLSDRAIVLFTFLIVAQDDTGYYPAAPTNLRRLVATRPTWSIEDVQGLIGELCQVGLARVEDGGVVLVTGVAKNGKPRKDTTDVIYARNANPKSTSGQLDVDIESPLHQSREEKSREDTPPKLRKNVTNPPPTTAAFTGDFLKLFKESELEGLRKRFPILDLAYEAEKCWDWWSKGKRPLSRPRLAFRNWLESATRMSKKRNDGTHRQGDPEYDPAKLRATLARQREAGLLPADDGPA